MNEHRDNIINEHIWFKYTLKTTEQTEQTDLCVALNFIPFQESGEGDLQNLVSFPSLSSPYFQGPPLYLPPPL